eukprot:scaffold2045_cov404-Prasinococcus_capsulatus_cf.AAC.61
MGLRCQSGPVRQQEGAATRRCSGHESSAVEQRRQSARQSLRRAREAAGRAATHGEDVIRRANRGSPQGFWTNQHGMKLRAVRAWALLSNGNADTPRANPGRRSGARSKLA